MEGFKKWQLLATSIDIDLQIRTG